MPIVFIVMNDSGLGMVMRGQGDKLIASEYRPTDYARLAEAYGGRGYRVEGPDQLRSTLEEALRSGVPSIIDVPIDPHIDYLKMRATDLVGYQYRAI